MPGYYIDLLEEETKNLDSKIKDTSLYKNCYIRYINQDIDHPSFKLTVFNPDYVCFKSSKLEKDKDGIKRKVFEKSVIKKVDSSCITYFERREFNAKHNITKLVINIESLGIEKINISVVKKDYGILLNYENYKIDDLGNYQKYIFFPSIAIPSFYVIPFGDIFDDICYSETTNMFEDSYSGILYPISYKKTWNK